MPVVVLLSGWSGAGKDAVGSILQTKWGFKRLAFADELKRLIAEEFAFPLEWTTTQEGKQNVVPTSGKTVRQLLIQRGQEIRAEKGDPGYFARYVGNQILEQIHSSNGFVITDWRLPIEITTLESIFASHNILLIKGRVYNSTQSESPVKDSTTENQLERFVFDAHIQNDGVSYAALEKEVTQKLYYHIHVEE
jgi:hypothetical protein